MYPHVAEDEKSTFIDNSVDICLLDVDNTDPRSPAVCNGQNLPTIHRNTTRRSTQLMPATHTFKKRVYQKLVQETCTKNLTQVHQFLAPKQLRPITLHGSCHVPDSFCAGIEQCCVLLRAKKTGTRLTGACFWYQFLERVSLALELYLVRSRSVTIRLN